jgi:uncharacterized protein YjbJ (UPF0337 family)
MLDGRRYGRELDANDLDHPCMPRCRVGIEEITKEVAMGNEDKMKNSAEGTLGKAKEKLGDATDDEKMQREGKTDQSKADVKQAGEKVKDAFNK